MFIGQFNHTIDTKNRIIIPAKFRELLGPNAVITIGNEGCLAIYTENEWTRLYEQLLSLNTNSSDARKHIRMIAGSASECQCDAQGRVILPLNLIQTCGITKEIVIVGNLDHIEIWAKEKWDGYYDDAVKNFDSITETLSQE